MKGKHKLCKRSNIHVRVHSGVICKSSELERVAPFLSRGQLYIRMCRLNSTSEGRFEAFNVCTGQDELLPVMDVERVQCTIDVRPWVHEWDNVR